MTSISKICYQADWAPSLDPNLHSKKHTLVQKVIDFVRKVVFFIPNYFMSTLVRWNVLPSSSFIVKSLFDSRNEIFQKALPRLQWDYQISELEVTTPDGIVLKGHYFKHPKHDQDPQSRVLMCFHGNCDFYQSGSTLPLMDLLASDRCGVPYSFALFNQRGVGNSTEGTPNERNLLIDAESVYQTVKNELKIPESQIDMYGHSLGGAEAAQLKKLHPHTGGSLFLDRTFSKLDMMVGHVLGTSFVGKLAQKIVKSYDWEFDTYKALEEVRDRVYVFTHMKDRNIPQSCSLSEALKKNPLTETPIESFHFLYSEYDPHMGPLSECCGRSEDTSILPEDLPEDTKELLLDCFNPARKLNKAAAAG